MYSTEPSLQPCWYPQNLFSTGKGRARKSGTKPPTCVFSFTPLTDELSYSKKNRLEHLCHEFPSHYSCGHSVCLISPNAFLSCSIISLMSGKILLPSEGMGVLLPPMALKLLNLPFWSRDSEGRLLSPIYFAVLDRILRHLSVQEAPCSEAKAAAF